MAVESYIAISLSPGEEEEAQNIWHRAGEVCQAALVRHGIGGRPLEITLVDEEAIAELNLRYRDRKGPTDVLSFSQDESLAEEADLGGDDMPEAARPVGDVVVCYSRARDQAKTFGHGLERELAFLALHGTLHLLGLDHQTPDEEARMMAEAEEILTTFGIVR